MTTTTAAASEQPAVKPFAAFLQEQRRGALHIELSEQLAALVQACLETGKKGQLAVTIAVNPTKGEEGTVLVTDAVTLKAPRPDARPSTFFTDDHGNLSRRDPRQAELPLREVPGGREDAAETA